MKQIAVKLTNISKRFTLQHERPTLIENILRSRTREKFWALRDINITVKKGERFGIIGPNGSGKTTLLEVIANITSQTAGTVIVNGKVVSLIELDAGFHPELTGEENIELNGLLLGMSKDEVRLKLKKMISFADIGNFIDAPMYTYSEGMKLRLGFSIVVNTDPDILLLDEHIAIGDQAFLKKSLLKIQEFFSQKKTVIIASHHLNAVRATCKRIIWLEKGRIIKDGPAKQIIDLYSKKYGRINKHSKLVE